MNKNERRRTAALTTIMIQNQTSQTPLPGLKNPKLNKTRSEMKTQMSNKVKINQKMKVMKKISHHLKESNKIMNMMTNSNLSMKVSIVPFPKDTNMHLK